MVGMGGGSSFRQQPLCNSAQDAVQLEVVATLEDYKALAALAGSRQVHSLPAVPGSLQAGHGAASARPATAGQLIDALRHAPPVAQQQGSERRAAWDTAAQRSGRT